MLTFFSLSLFAEDPPADAPTPAPEEVSAPRDIGTGQDLEPSICNTDDSELEAGGTVVGGGGAGAAREE